MVTQKLVDITLLYVGIKFQSLWWMQGSANQIICKEGPAAPAAGFGFYHLEELSQLHRATLPTSMPFWGSSLLVTNSGVDLEAQLLWLDLGQL